MKKFIFVIKMALVTVVAAGLLLSSGCQHEFDPNMFHMYYVNGDKTSLVPVEYTLHAESPEEGIDEVLRELGTETGRVEYIQTIPSTVDVLKYELANGFLKIYFGGSYKELDPVTEVLCRAGIVKTMLQIPEVSTIAFYVNGEALTDANGQIVGIMNSDSFIDNPGESIQTIQETELTLYFASTDGQGLVKEVREIHYNSNVPLEKSIVEHLLKGPYGENSQRAIPAETKLITVSVLDGICVVNFDNGFLAHNFDVAEEVVIYSIVNSLTELDTIKTVQISVNGETNRIYREKYSLADQYERDLSLVKDNSAVQVVEEQTAPTGGVLNNRTE